MPLQTAAMACSRTPKWIWRPANVPRATAAPPVSAHVDSVRSAEPPTSSGITAASSPRTLPDALLVAMAAPSKVGSASRTPGASRPASRRSHSAPSSGRASRMAAKRRSHRGRSARLAATSSASRQRTSSGTKKLAAGQPKRAFSAEASSGPRAAPCAPDVPAFVGAPKPIVVRTRMKRRPVAVGERLADRTPDRRHVVAVVDLVDVPAVRRGSAPRRPR